MRPAPFVGPSETHRDPSMPRRSLPRARSAAALDLLPHRAESPLGIDPSAVAVLHRVETKASENFLGAVGLSALRRVGAANDRRNREEQGDESRRHEEPGGPS
jgi:hypothetical protein